MASAVLSTLHHVTERKLSKLAEQRQKFESHKKSILEAVRKEPSQAKKVRMLLDGCQKYGITGRIGVQVKNIERFLDQADHDPSVSSSLLHEWQQKIERDLNIQSLKYKYADLFGRLVTEWIENPNSAQTQHSGPGRRPGPPSPSDPDSFEHVGREEMHEQRKQWESYAFSELKRDQTAIDTYLKDLFSPTRKGKKLTITPLHQLQLTMGKFDEMEPKRFTEDVVRWCISGVIKAGLFSGKKQEGLLDLQDRDTVMKEMADVLNMELDSLGTWKWDPAPVPLHMRRQINGKYRVFYDEDIHQAILLHFIGAKWAVHMKTAFTAFFHSGAWTQSPFHAMGREARQRRGYFIGNTSTSSIRNTRRTTYASDYFMTQLPSGLKEGRDYSQADLDWQSAEDGKSPLEIKESMHRLATTEMLINSKVYGQFTIIQSDFKWFGPSMPHDTIFAVLKFLGVKGKWLNFFQKFLTAEVVFSQDGPDPQVQRRRRGIPITHALSDALGEAVLFCLDFAVNKKTGGSDLYRFHDDLWFWGQESSCIEAWKAMREFADMMGLELNEEKTGCVQIFENPKDTKPIPPGLPRGNINWGFLYLDSKKGRWLIDNQKVEEHVTELQRQLKSCRSVFAWVQAWNSYVTRFFSTNFGIPAHCFGREHVQMVIETFKVIQRKLFGASGNVTGYLRQMIEEGFGVSDIPDGFLYFPVELGGLALRNPFIPLFAMQTHALKNPMERIERAFEQDKAEYEKKRKIYEDGGDIYRPSGGWKPEKADEPFMSRDEFTMFREETSQPLLQAYQELLQVPPEDAVEPTPEVSRALADLVAGEYSTPGFSSSWHSLSPYWKWILELYAGDMVKRFGGLEMGEKGLLPMGLVSTLRSEKTRWQD
jgi:hypothetical protein